MSLNLDKSSWKRVALGDVIRHVTDRVDAETSGLERFLAGEHIPSNSLHITKWGVIGRDPIGPMFYKRFRPGHVLYVSRRSYLRKTAVPEFEGITGEKTFVLETRDPSVLLQEFMPFLLSAESFHSYAVANSRGSVNPYINWTDLANYQFDLPPLDEQKRLADLFWAAERHRRRVSDIAMSLAALRSQMFRAWLAGVNDWTELGEQFDVQLGKMLSSKTKPTVENPGFPYLANINVRWGDFDLSDLRHVALDEREREKFLVRDGDILVCEGGEVGRAAIWDSRIEEVYYQKALHRLRPRSQSALPGQLLISYLRTLADGGHLTAHSTGSTFAHLTRERLVRVRIPTVSSAVAAMGLNALSLANQASHADQTESERLISLGKALMLDVFGGSQ